MKKIFAILLIIPLFIYGQDPITHNKTICPGNAIILCDSIKTTYSWSTGEATSSISVSPTATTIYTVTRTTGTNSATGSVTVTVVDTCVTNIAMFDSLKSNSLDHNKWTIINLTDCIAQNEVQNVGYQFSGNHSATTITFGNIIRSVINTTSNTPVIQSNFTWNINSANEAAAGLYMWFDNYNYAVISSRSTGGQYRVSVYQNNVAVYNVGTGINKGYDVKITYDRSSHQTKFWYWNNSWIQMGATQTYNIDNGQPAFMMMSHNDIAASNGCGVSTFNNAYLSTSDYTARYPFGVSTNNIGQIPDTAQVVVIIGGSNADGNGTVTELSSYLQGYQYSRNIFWKTNGNVSTQNGNWYPMKAGFNTQNPNSTLTTKCGFEEALSYKLQNTYNKNNVFLIKAARGSTPLGGDADPTWKYSVSGSLYDRMKNNYIADALVKIPSYAKNYRIAALIINLGGTDTPDSLMSYSYETNLTNLINNFRSIYGANIPVIIHLLNDIHFYGIYWEIVRRAQESIGSNMSNVFLINADAVQYQSDGLHYTTAGNEDVGNQTADKLIQINAIR